MTSKFVTLTSVNKSQFDDSYYASIDPERLRKLVKALDEGRVYLGKTGKVSLKGWKNTPEDGGTPYISLKWSPPMDAARVAPADPAISLEDVPF